MQLIAFIYYIHYVEYAVYFFHNSMYKETMVGGMMSKLKEADHPTVKSYYEKKKLENHSAPLKLEASWLKEIALDSGADDVGIVEIERTELDDQRDEILDYHPWTKSILSFVLKMNVESVRSPARSVSNVEMHHKIEEINHISGKIVTKLQEKSIRAVNPAGGFPMEITQYPNRIWVLGHKPVAVAAGLGHMGIHRNVIHPKFGNFILLGSILIDAEISDYDKPIEYNPCLECNLCVAACPVGAISTDSKFNFTACYTHNYREFMGGFNDWIEQIVDSKSVTDFRSRIHAAESSSFWQSLSFGPSYKSAYCLSVCPAGEDIIGPYLENKKKHIQEVVKPLQEKVETIYVVPNSDAEEVVKKKFKYKNIKHASNSLNPISVRGFINALSYVFQKDQSKGINAVFHFRFYGDEEYEATVEIKDQEVTTEHGLIGSSDLTVTADAKTWLSFLAQETNIIWALVSRKVKLKGSPLLLMKFAKCFPVSPVKKKQSKYIGRMPLVGYTPLRFLKNDPETGRISEELLEEPKWLGDMQVIDIKQETPLVKTFRLVDCQGNVPFTYEPGQFLTLTVYPSGKRYNRSYTVASTPSRGECIEITVKREEFGIVSRYLHDEINIGDTITVHAPSGNFTFSGKGHNSIVLIAGGVGITPLMSVARYLCDNKWDGEIYFIIGQTTPEECIFQNEIIELEKNNPNLHVLITLSRADGTDWKGYKGRISQDIIGEFVPNIQNKLIHICGPVPMMEATKQIVSELGVPNELIMLENFGTDKRNPTLVSEVDLGAVTGRVKFVMSGKDAEIREKQTILELADQLDIYIDNACRSGTCGSCKVSITTGSVNMATEDALSDDEKKEGIILACQSLVDGDVEIDV